jgi:predicted PhzF superfamily epimerase YddE/YHI9
MEGEIPWVGLPVPAPVEIPLTPAALAEAALPADAVTGPALSHADTLLVPLRDRYALEEADRTALALARAAGARRLALYAPGAARDAFRVRVFGVDEPEERPASALAGAVLAAREAARRRAAVALHLAGGHAIGRPSEVLVRCAEPEAMRVWVGGSVVKVLAGGIAGPGGSR